MGITFSSNLTWTHHLEKGTDAILSKCKQKLAALKYVANGCTIKQKKLLADACIMSRITYGIQIWGNMASPSVIYRAQVVQNQLACWILNSHRLTKTSNLLNKLNWLSMNQLTVYHSLFSIWKTLRYKLPYRNYIALLKNKNKTGRINLTNNTWSVKAQKIYWNLPNIIRKCEKISHFKLKLKKWISSNIPVGDPMKPNT